MKWILAILALLPLTGSCSDTNDPNNKWPKAIAEFPTTESKPVRVDGFEISWEESKDQKSGGSGGPIIVIKVRDLKTGRTITLTEQSAGERLLERYNGKPQLEIWGRGGGGNWVRELWRFEKGAYRSVRIDDFEQSPKHDNQSGAVAQLPDCRHGKGDYAESTVYFIGTRIPQTKE